MIILLKFMAVGLGGSMALILLAKVILAQLLQRENDYYTDEYDRGGEDHA
ncbi:hypothetical protein ACPW7J_04455 [Ihubacter sp. rT4E-8]